MARIARRFPRRAVGGFSLVELSIAVAIVAILAAVALPSYRSYVERAHLAEVLVQYDAMREKAQLAATESNRDLCNWQVTWSGTGAGARMDAQTAAIEAIVRTGINALDGKRWKPALSHLSTTITAGAPPAPLTVQFAGVGAEGVARVRLLAAEFQKTGQFNKWGRESSALTVFTVFLGTCQPGAAQDRVVASAIATAPHLTQRPSCAPTQQVGPDGTSCVAKVCGPGLVMDATSGACNPGCKPGEFAPTFRHERGTGYQVFDQPASGPHSCFSVATQSCPSDKPIPILEGGALVCEAYAKGDGGQGAAAGNVSQPGPCTSVPNANPFMDINLAQKLPYKAHDCGGNPPEACEFAAGSAGATTCPPGQFPYVSFVNEANGNRNVQRGCKPAADCKAEWWNQSSQTEACTSFVGGKTYTQAFSCTYCCAGDNCNGNDLNPDGSNASAGACPVNPSQMLKWN